MARFRVVIRSTETYDREYFVEGMTNAQARADAMRQHRALAAPCTRSIVTVEVVSTKVVSQKDPMADYAPDPKER